MKVLNIIHRYHPAIGGSETWCRNISNFLSKKGIIVEISTVKLYNMEEVYVDLSKKAYFSLGDYDDDNGIAVRRHALWSFCRKTPAVFIFNFILRNLGMERTEIGRIFRNSPLSFDMYVHLFRMIKKADIVHLHTLPYFHNIAGYWIAKFFKKKIVITPHFHPFHREYEKKILYRILNYYLQIFCLPFLRLQN